MTFEDGHKRADALADKLLKYASYNMLEQALDLFDDAACCYEAGMTLATALMCRAALDSMLRCVWAAAYKVTKITPAPNAPSGYRIDAWDRIDTEEMPCADGRWVVIGRRDLEEQFIGQPVLAVPIRGEKYAFPEVSKIREFLVRVGVLTSQISSDIEKACEFGHRAAHLEERWMKMIAQKIEPSLDLKDEQKGQNPYLTKDEAKQALEIVERALLHTTARWDELAAPVQVPLRNRMRYG